MSPPPSPPTRQPLNFTPTSTMKYKVYLYLTCEGTALITVLWTLPSSIAGGWSCR